MDDQVLARLVELDGRLTDRDILDHPWYRVCAELAVAANAKDQPGTSVVTRQLGALAFEILHWVPEAFLAHAVLFLRGRDELLVNTVIQGTSDQLKALSDGLRGYVKEHGSTVRIDVQLRHTPGADGAPRRMVRDGLVQSGWERLEHVGPGQGLPDAYKRLVARVLFEGRDNDIRVLQYAGGTDWLTEGEPQRPQHGAVAHLYLAGRFPAETLPTPILQTVRASLSRIAMRHAVEELSRLEQRAIEATRIERRRREQLEASLKKVESAVSKLDVETRELRRKIVGSPLLRFSPGLEKLKKLIQPGAYVRVQGVPLIGNHNEWTSELQAAAKFCLAGLSERATERFPGDTLEMKWAQYQFFAERKLRSWAKKHGPDSDDVRRMAAAASLGLFAAGGFDPSLLAFVKDDVVESAMCSLTDKEPLKLLQFVTGARFDFRGERKVTVPGWMLDRIAQGLGLLVTEAYKMALSTEGAEDGPLPAMVWGVRCPDSATIELTLSPVQLVQRDEKTTYPWIGRPDRLIERVIDTPDPSGARRQTSLAVRQTLLTHRGAHPKSFPGRRALVRIGGGVGVELASIVAEASTVKLSWSLPADMQAEPFAWEP